MAKQKENTPPAVLALADLQYQLGNMEERIESSKKIIFDAYLQSIIPLEKEHRRMKRKFKVLEKELISLLQ